MPRSRRRGYGPYEPLGEGPGRRRPWLRTAQLNVRGWSALIGLCALAGLAGTLLARAIDVPAWAGSPLALLPLGAVILVDRRRWAAMETSYGWGGSVADVSRMVEELRAYGVAAAVRPDPRYEQPWWDRIDSPADPEPTASLVYANRDEAAVRTVLRGHGVDLPDLP
ncbi:hypothetical protein [Intrasporangium calvum]|uniref:Uncharacterized protein n=1 Tax=Intrasporangium calvum (strain ATCC 23552 / DSM 43043 / JCM 3097 / NBRC 12989 / NCIMB 10167 / NRRL B-3866 / 7 KIP) TaxID=710696 RepID=E6SFG1_INTC7|nr:hypothetical protein [Intrasporangium calvum]ADU46699.1 hypothetical protein Intca_0138 [Intrasporangium calvum DSM 43043]